MMLIVLIVTNYYLCERLLVYQTVDGTTFIQSISHLKSYYFKVKKMGMTLV